MFSLRTNLIDVMFSLDLAHSEGANRDDIKRYCFSQVHQDQFDWYYDLSSSRKDHLEMPVYADLDVGGDVDNFAKQLLGDVLVGTPISRDVTPLESGDTVQRGGLMVIINRGDQSFKPLALQQHAPTIQFSDGTTSHSRRSDSFWCEEVKSRGLNIVVDKHLFVYHDNQFDTVPSPTGIRK